MKVLFHCVKPFVDVATGYTKRFDIIGDRPHVLRQGGERELGDPAPCLTQPPGDRQREQAAPSQAQEEHQEHVGVRVISHYGLDTGVRIHATSMMLNQIKERSTDDK